MRVHVFSWACSNLNFCNWDQNLVPDDLHFTWAALACYTLLQQEPLNMNHVCSNLLIRHSLWSKMNAVYVHLWFSISDYTTCQIFMKFSLGIIQKLLNRDAFCENWLSIIIYLGGKWIYTHIFHISWSVWVKLDK